jgi:hypothetical protein
MSEPTPEPVPAAPDLQPVSSDQQLADALAEIKQLTAELDAAQAASLPAAPKKPSKTVAILKKVGASLLAALTTPEAVKAEKSLAIVALTRALILLPGAAVIIDVILAALGAPHVGAK